MFYSCKILIRFNWIADDVYYAINEKFYFVSGLFFYINASVNPLIYNMMSAKYRKAFKNTFCRGYFTMRGTRYVKHMSVIFLTMFYFLETKICQPKAHHWVARLICEWTVVVTPETMKQFEVFLFLLFHHHLDFLQPQIQLWTWMLKNESRLLKYIWRLYSRWEYC